MKRIIRTVMFIAAAAMTLPSCTKDFNEVTVDDKPAGNVSLALSASLNDVRVSREDSGKLNWEASDAIGVFIGADKNLRARTDETLCADGRFFTTDGTETSGTLYAYYPYNEYASESTGAADVWVSMAQGQLQSAGSVCEVGRYLTMVAAPATVTGAEGEKVQLSFSALGSAIRFSIYDTSGRFASEKVKSVTVTSDNALVGGYKYDMTTSSFDMASSINRKSGIVNVAEPFAVSENKDVYMAVMPGSHTCKVVVTTDGGAHVFNFSSAFVCEASKMGTVKLNLGNEAVEHYILYQPFDLMIWGGDYMHNGEMGISPVGENEPATADFTGEEPFAYPNSDKGTDGTASYTSMNEMFLLSRGVEDYVFNRAYERPGHIKLGTASGAWDMTLPVMAGLSPSGEAVKITFTANHWSSAKDDVALVVVGDGLIDGRYEEVICDVPSFTGGVAAAPNYIVTLSYNIYGATNNTQLRLEGRGVSRTNLDDLFVERIEGATPLLAVMNINEESTPTSIKVSWEPISGAVSYNYDVVDANGDDVTSGSTDVPEVTISPLMESSSYKISIQAVADTGDTAHTSSAWSEYFAISTTSSIQDSHESGYVFFEDDLNWLDASFAPGLDKWTDGFVDLGWQYINSDNTYCSAEALALWEDKGYTFTDRSYVNLGNFKIGRAYNASGHTGTITLPAAPLSEVTAGASVNVVFHLDLARTNTNDTYVFLIKAITGEKEQIREIEAPIATMQTWEPYSVTFDNVTADTTFILYTEEQTSGKANRFYIDNLRIVKE